MDVWICVNINQRRDNHPVLQQCVAERVTEVEKDAPCKAAARWELSELWGDQSRVKLGELAVGGKEASCSCYISHYNIEQIDVYSRGYIVASRAAPLFSTQYTAAGFCSGTAPRAPSLRSSGGDIICFIPTTWGP